MVQKLVNTIKQMDARDPFRIEMTDMLLDKLYNMGAIPTKKSLLKCENLSVSTFCRSPGEVYKRAGEMVGSQLE
ncbi:unnamed protein product [Urochloa humidicola]